MSPFAVILSEARNLALPAQGKLCEGPLAIPRVWCQSNYGRSSPKMWAQNDLLFPSATYDPLPTPPSTTYYLPWKG